MNETSILHQVKSLYENDLHSNVTVLSTCLLPLIEKVNETLSSNVKYQLVVYFANSHYKCRQLQKAEALYQKAIQIYKSIGKNARIKSDASQEISAPDMDLNSIKYQIYLCHVNTDKFTEAISILESIPAKVRTTRVNMSLGKLYQQSGQERSAITAFKEVVKECPLALEAVKTLLLLGVKGAEVSSLVFNSSASVSSIDWLPLWIKAHAQFYAKDYTQCLLTIKQFESKMNLNNFVDLLVLKGEVYYYNGDYKLAENALERAQSNDPYVTNGMDIYALLLAKENKLQDLESLSTNLMNVTENAPEPWFATALFCQVTRKATRAVYFAQKACLANPRSVEALLLKGFILMDLRKLQEAAFHFREALNIAPYRYQPHKGLVECHMAMGKTREAITMASNACKQLGNSARALTLYARVLAKEPITRDKARSLLEKALVVDNDYLPAIYKLAELYEQEKQQDKAIELLKKQIEKQSNCKLHTLLAELLFRTKDNEKALDHFSIALKYEPNNSRALEGMHRVEQQSDLVDSTYDADDVVDSDTEEGIESEVEAVWSDVDFS